MITQMRRHMHSTFFKVILGVSLGTLLFGGALIELISAITKRSSAVLRVNGVDFSAQDIITRALIHENQMAVMKQMTGQSIDLDPKKAAYESLTRDALLNKQAHSLGIVVSEKDAKNSLGDLYTVLTQLDTVVPFSLIDLSTRTINPSALRNFLKSTGQTTAQFYKNIEQALQRNVLKGLIEEAVYVPNFELNYQYANKMLDKSFSLAKYNVAPIIDQVRSEEITPREVETFYNNSKDQYAIPEKRTGVLWKFTPPAYGIVISPEAIKAYYQAHQSDYLEKGNQVRVRSIMIKKNEGARAAIDKIYSELKENPQGFADKATSLSHDEVTAAKGGDTGYFVKGTHDREFEKAAFLLKNSGDISSVIEAGDAYYLLQLVDKKEATYKPLEIVESDIKNRLMEQEFKVSFEAQARSAITNARTNDQSVLKFAAERHGQKQELTDKERQGSASPSEALYQLMAPGAYSSFVAQGAGYIVRLDEIRKSSVPALSIIQDKVKEDYIRHKALMRLSTELKEKKRALSWKSLEEFKQVTADANKSETIGMVSADSKGKTDTMTSVWGMSSQMREYMGTVGDIMIVLTPEFGTLARLDAVAQIDAQDFEKNKKDAGRDADKDAMALTYAGFVASLYRSAKIKQD